jgi:hypothetical protein
MPYIGGTGLIDDVYHSGNVFANFVNIALWNDPQGPAAAVLGQIMAPTFQADAGIIALDGDEDPNVVDKQQSALVTAGIVSQNDLNLGNNPVAGTSDSKPGTSVAPVTTSTTVDPNQTTFPDSYQLSTNYTLGGVTKAPGVVFTHPVEASAGLTVAEVVANLQLLAQNCMEPIKAHRPDMYLTNSFRPAGIGSPTSQHPKGQACDMQFSKASRSDYFTIAQWIRDNVSYDQLLLEYKTTGSGLPWIHISFNGTGNRSQVLTFMNDKKYAAGLTDLSATA